VTEETDMSTKNPQEHVIFHACAAS